MVHLGPKTSLADAAAKAHATDAGTGGTAQAAGPCTPVKKNILGALAVPPKHHCTLAACGIEAMSSTSRPALPAVMVLALCAVAALYAMGGNGSAFLAQKPATTMAPAVREVAEQQRLPVDAVALGAVAGLLTSQPANAAMLYDEIIPYAGATSFAILWGIVLGFVLLRLQEAFPE